MTVAIEQILYLDPQDQIPAGQCPVCGGAVYYPGLHCTRCREEGL